MDDTTDQYRQAAQLWESIDYGDRASVRRCNKASDRMRELVQGAERAGSDATAAFLPLPDEVVPARWLAHHLVEMASIDRATEKRCLRIVKQHIEDLRRRGQGADVMGEEMWLKEHEKG